MAKTDQVWDGEPFDIEGDEVRLVCCHCDLTHDVKIEKRRGGYRLTFKINDRSTAARRRHSKKGN